MTEPDHCWSMERIGVGEVPYLLNNIKDTIRIGRSAALNDKICAGNHVSKQHIKLQRFGAVEDWRNIRWSVQDNNTSNGTFVNAHKIPINVAYNLNPDDILGMGCPTKKSMKAANQETFVYQIRAPKSLCSPIAANNDMDEQDTDTDMAAITDEDEIEAGPSPVAKKDESSIPPALKLPQTRPELPDRVPTPEPGPSKPKEKLKIRPCDRKVLPKCDDRVSKNESLNSEASPSTPATPIQVQTSGGKLKVCEGKDGVPIILLSSENSSRNNSDDSHDSINQDLSQPSSSQIQSPSLKKTVPKDSDRNEPTTSTASGGKSKDETGPKTSKIKAAEKRRRRKSSSSSETKAKSVKTKRVNNLFSSSSDSDVNEYVLKPAKKKFKKTKALALLDTDSDSDMEVNQVWKEQKNKLPSKSIDCRKCDVKVSLNAAKPPKQCLSARVGVNDNLKWIKLGKDDYRKNFMILSGLPPDGSKGEPLSMAGCLEDNFSDISSSDDEVVEVKPSKGSKSRFSDISSDEELSKSGREKVEKSIKSRPKRCSPISSEEESFVRSAVVDTTKTNGEKSKNYGQAANENSGQRKTKVGPNHESKSNKFGYGLKIKKEHFKSTRKNSTSDSNDDFPGMNYSQHEIIILSDSDKEDEYSQNILSQSLFIENVKEEKLDEDNEDVSSKEDEFDDVEDLLRDSPSPDGFSNQDGEVSEDLVEEELVEEDLDDEEVEILEVSSSSQLFNRIKAKAYKLEPQEEAREENSQSLLEPIESQKMSDKSSDDGDMAMEIMNLVKGSDLNMVGNALRKTRYENTNGHSEGRKQKSRVWYRDKAMVLVQEEVQNMTIHRVAVKNQCPNWIVREIFHVLKEQIRIEDDLGMVNEEDLSKKVEERLEEDRIVKKLAKEMENSGDTIAECCMEMKKNEVTITEDSLRKKVLEKNTLEDSIANLMEHNGCTEVLARNAVQEVLDERGKWVEAEVLKKIKDMKEFNEKAASIAMELDCDLEEAEDALKSENNDAQTAAGIIVSNKELKHKSQQLAEAFSIPIEKANSALLNAGLNEDLASQSIMEEQAVESVVETTGCSPSLAKETLEKYDMDKEKAVEVVQRDDIDCLLDDIDEDNYSTEADLDEAAKSPSEERGHGSEEPRSDVFDDDDMSTDKNETANALSSTSHKDSTSSKKNSFSSTKPIIPTHAKTLVTGRPDMKRQQSAPSGVQMIDAPPMPARRAFNRGISQGTRDTILEKNKNRTPLKKADPWCSKTPPIKKYNGMFAKRGPEIDNSDISKVIAKSKIQIQADKKKKLKEIEERKKEESAKKLEENRIKPAPSGKMKKSQPKIMKMLDESLISTTPVSRHKVIKVIPAPAVSRQRHASGSTSESARLAEVTQRRTSVTSEEPIAPRQRRGSVSGFLVDEARLDTKKKEKSSILKKEKTSKYAISSDGQRVSGKMTFSNIDYNVASQDISKMVIDTSKMPPMPTFGFAKPKEKAKKRKSVRWKDTDGMGDLVDTKLIPSCNTGVKPSSKNKDSIQIPLDTTTTITSKKKELHLDDIFRDILAWNPLWMVEQKKKEFQKEPPPVHNKWRVSPVTLVYQSWDDYKRIFVPLMLHELWASITTEVTEKEERKLDDSIHVCLTEIHNDKEGKFTQISCIGLLSQTERDRDLGSAVGTLVQLTLRYSLGVKQGSGKKQASALSPVFAYVKEVSPARRENESTGELDLNRLRQLEQAASTTNRKGKSLTWIVRYTVLVLSDRLNDRTRDLDQDKISYDKPIVLTVKSRIEHELRNFRAVIDLPKSKLYDIILKPEAKSFHVGQGSEHLHASIKDVPSLKHLNSLQKKVVVSVTRACLLEPTQPKICLVQGPPGTGKSRTITGIIIQFLFSRGNNSEPAPRILVVAPSNAAVDELAIKLMAAKEEMSGPAKEKLNILRIGREKVMNPKVRPVSFESSTKLIIDKETNKHRSTSTLEQDIALKQANVNRLWNRKEEASNEGNEDMAKKFKREWEELNQQIKKIKKTMAEPLDFKVRRQIEANAKQQIMGGADVILTTLSSSTNGLMERYFLNDTTRGHRPFSVCIMDEASQCVEPEALIPFKFGFSKLVMVGDHEQLPATVTSRKAKQNEYQQSLFNRLFTYFTSGGIGDYVGRLEGAGNTPPMKGSKSPVLRLETQYRMHPAIMEWPSRYFYGGQLVAGPQDRNCPLSPYTVLETTATEISRNGQIWNEEEANYVAQIVSTVRRMDQKLSIGVITFYAQQKKVINLALQNKKIPTEGSNCVIVNTVDGFQGSERDVIIISCVRGGGDSIGFLADRQRLNVALTRAKFSMIVIGNIQTLKKKNEMFGELVANATERKCLFSLNNSTNLNSILSSNR